MTTTLTHFGFWAREKRLPFEKHNQIQPLEVENYYTLRLSTCQFHSKIKRSKITTADKAIFCCFCLQISEPTQIKPISVCFSYSMNEPVLTRLFRSCDFFTETTKAQKKFLATVKAHKYAYTYVNSKIATHLIFTHTNFQVIFIFDEIVFVSTHRSKVTNLIRKKFMKYNRSLTCVHQYVSVALNVNGCTHSHITDVWTSICM